MKIINSINKKYSRRRDEKEKDHLPDCNYLNCYNSVCDMKQQGVYILFVKHWV